MIVRSAVRFFAVTLACAAVASSAAGPAPDLAAAFERLAARVSPDDVRRNIAEADWKVWNETAWPAVRALEDFYRETKDVAVLAMADGDAWTNGLAFALGGAALSASELQLFLLLNRTAQQYAHVEDGIPELPCRFPVTDSPFPAAIKSWRALVARGWLLDWDDRRLVVRAAPPPPLPGDAAESEAAADFAALLACQHHFRDDPARIRPDPFLRPVSRTEQSLLVQSWKSIRQAGLAVEKTSDGGWRLVGDSDAVLPPVSVLAAAMWPDRLVHPSGKEPGIRRAQALCVLSLLRPAQLSAVLAGPRDDPRRGFVLRALGLAHAFGCAPEWDGTEWTDAADRFALDDDARREPARALLFQNALFAPYRDEIEAAAAPAR